MRLRIVSLLSLACASALFVTGCNQSIVTTTSGTSGNNGASYIFATNYNATVQQGTILSFPITQVPVSTAAVAPASATQYPGQVTAVTCAATASAPTCGAGYTVAPVITIAAPTTLPANGGTTATAVATINSAGSISTITIVNPGSGYTAAPLVTVPAPPSGDVAPGLSASITSTAFIPVTTYTAALSTTPAVPTYLNGQTYYTQLGMDSVADGRLYYASYPWTLPNVVTVHEATTPNPPTVIAQNGQVLSVSLTTAGAGYTSAPPVVIAPPTSVGGTQATAVATLSSSTGPVSGLTITANGAGYTSNPTVAISVPTSANGTPATATATEVGGFLTTLTLVNAGTGYTAAPTVTISGGGASVSATATATVAAPYGALTGITVTNGGSGYTTAAPALTIGPPQSQATATALLNTATGSVTGYVVDNGGIGYPAIPTVTVSAPNTATATATATANAAGQLNSIVVNNPGFGYAAAPTVTITAQAVPSAPVTATATIASGSVTSVAMTASGGGFLSAPTVTFSLPGVNATATSAVSSGGIVTGTTVTNGGQGYTSTPAITFSAPTSGTTATGTATVVNGVVTAISITNAGTGYTTAPTVTIAATPTAAGTAATGTTTISSSTGGIVTAVNVTNGGSGYAFPPTLTFSTPATPVAATATATISNGYVTGFHILTAGSGYTTSPIVSIAAPSATSLVTATGTAVLNSTTGAVQSITLGVGGSGYVTTPTVTIASNGSVQAVGAAVASTPGTGAVSVGALNVGKNITDALQSNFKSMTFDRAGNMYVSEANGHIIAISNTVTSSTTPIATSGNGSVAPSTAVTDYDLSTDAAGTGNSSINSTGIGASNTGFDIMATDLDENLYTYVAGSGIITEYNYNPTYNFPPFTGTAVCPIGTSQCYVGSTAVTTPPVFPTANRTITLPSSITNVVDIVTDIYQNVYVLSQNGGAGQATVTEFAPCTASCTPTIIKTIGGSNTGFNTPGSLAVDTVGNVYVEDFSTTSTTLNDFFIFTSVESGNVAPTLSFTENMPNTLPVGSAQPTGYGLAVY